MYRTAMRINYLCKWQVDNDYGNNGPNICDM